MWRSEYSECIERNDRASSCRLARCYVSDAKQNCKQSCSRCNCCRLSLWEINFYCVVEWNWKSNHSFCLVFSLFTFSFSINSQHKFSLFRFFVVELKTWKIFAVRNQPIPGNFHYYFSRLIVKAIALNTFVNKMTLHRKPHGVAEFKSGKRPQINLEKYL